MLTVLENGFFQMKEENEKWKVESGRW